MHSEFCFASNKHKQYSKVQWPGTCIVHTTFLATFASILQELNEMGIHQSGILPSEIFLFHNIFTTTHPPTSYIKLTSISREKDRGGLISQVSLQAR